MNDDATESEPGGRRRALRWLSALLILVVLGVGAYAATRSALLDVDAVEVEVEGGRVTVGEVLAAAGVSLGDPMVDVDTEVVDARVSALPWVREALVDRVWPGTVRISVSERRAVVVAVGPTGDRALLDRTGTVLEATSLGASTLPTIRVDAIAGPGTQVHGITPLLRAAEEITPDLGAWITALSPTGDGVRAELVGGVIAELGIGSDYRDEMRSLATVLTRVELSCLEVIDVSIHENPVLLRTQGDC